MLRTVAILAIPAVQTICILLGFRFEQFYFTSAVMSFILTDLFLVPFFSQGVKKSIVFSYSFPPLALSLAMFGLLFFIESESLKIGILWVNGLLQFQYMLSLYFVLFKPDHFQVRSFLHSTHLMGVALFFSVSAVVYGLAYFVDMPYWYSFPPLLGLTLLWYCHQLLMHGFVVRENRPFLFSMILIASELFLTLSLLPSIYYVNASLWTAGCMTAFTLSLASLKKERTKFETISTVAVAAVVVVLVVLTAQWR